MNNTKPSRSLGGQISNRVVSVEVNGLFPRATKEGGTTYRCIYAINLDQSMTVSDLVVWITDYTDIEESSTEIGIDIKDEQQKIILESDSPGGGYFTLRYTTLIDGELVYEISNPIYWVPNPSQTNSNIKEALDAMSLIDEVEVISEISFGLYQYTITFIGESSNREHMLLEIEENNIFGENELSVESVQKGGPINAEAVDIGFENQPPNGIIFTDPSSEEDSIFIGELKPLDKFAIWLKRTVEEFSDDLPLDSEDNVILHFSGTVTQEIL